MAKNARQRGSVRFMYGGAICNKAKTSGAG